jgi:hypothetical protein
MRKFRWLGALVSATLLGLIVATSAYGHVVSKSITTEAGNCTTAGTPQCNAAALYTPNIGFTGTLTFSADEIGDQVRVVDYICVHTPGGAQFKSFGGANRTYTLTLREGAATIGSATYDVTPGLDCTGNAPVGVTAASGALITVPADGTVDYRLAIEGVTAGASAQATFSSYNSIRNEAFDNQGGVARSISVQPPTNFIIPEAPLAVLLLLSGAVAVGLWLMVSRRRSVRVTA